MTSISHVDLLPLQLWLSKQLPEEIEIHNEPDAEENGYWGLFHWRDGSGSIHETSWDYIVRRVEEKLTQDPRFKHNYGVTLALEVLRAENAYFDESTKEPILNGFGFCDIALLPWPTRTIALMKMKGETE